MEKEVLLKKFQKASSLEQLYSLWNELKEYLEKPSFLELGQLFGFQYHLQDQLNNLSDLYLQEKKYEESIIFHEDFIKHFKDDKYLCPFYKNLALSYFYQNNEKGLTYFEEVLQKYPYDYDLMDHYFGCLFKYNPDLLKEKIQKNLPLSIEYNIETKDIIHHVVDLLKAIHEDNLALKYSQIEKNQNDFGKRKPTKVIKVGRNDPCPCGSGKKYKKCCGRP